ncbi:hypothetical protein R3P38DRAFT_3192938 [Favolaschia claudopus]|uniref:Uncharacterized protein n=1 Tax=Favolaschia claudopus TaxID=2862362 RepID=A0AAW0BLT2_9AGAR
MPLNVAIGRSPPHDIWLYATLLWRISLPTWLDSSIALAAARTFPPNLAAAHFFGSDRLLCLDRHTSAIPRQHNSPHSGGSPGLCRPWYPSLALQLRFASSSLLGWSSNSPEFVGVTILRLYRLLAFPTCSRVASMIRDALLVPLSTLWIISPGQNCPYSASALQFCVAPSLLPCLRDPHPLTDCLASSSRGLSDESTRQQQASSLNLGVIRRTCYPMPIILITFPCHRHLAVTSLDSTFKFKHVASASSVPSSVLSVFGAANVDVADDPARHFDIVAIASPPSLCSRPTILDDMRTRLAVS